MRITDSLTRATADVRCVVNINQKPLMINDRPTFTAIGCNPNPNSILRCFQQRILSSEDSALVIAGNLMSDEIRSNLGPRDTFIHNDDLVATEALSEKFSVVAVFYESLSELNNFLIAEEEFEISLPLILVKLDSGCNSVMDITKAKLSQNKIVSQFFKKYSRKARN